MTFTPTEEQSAVIAFAKNSKESLLISALAGAAKTTTLVQAAHAMWLQPTLCCAFNKRIADEMAKRMPGHITCATMNSLGHRAWGAFVGRRLTVSTDKSYNTLSALVKDLRPEEREAAGEAFSSMLRALRLAKSSGYIPKKFSHLGKALIEQVQFRAAAAAGSDVEPDSLFWKLVDEAVNISIAESFQGQIDFDDQIYMSTLFGASYAKFPVVMVDEAQDLSPLNHKALEQMFGGRLIAVGDPCQPPGTLVSVVEYIGDSWNPRRIKQVPIEDLKVGDRLVGYDTIYSEFLFNRAVEGISSRLFKGNLINLITEKGVTKYTPNHHCFANFSRLRKRTALYLMRSENRWRVGVAAMDYKHASGPIARARAEKADALWVLDTFETKREALEVEAAIQAAYGIPDITFEWAGVHTRGYASEEALEAVWQRIAEIDFTSRAEDLLKAFRRELAYPIWTPEKTYLSFKRPMVVQACNLLEGGEVLPFAGKKREMLADWRDYLIRYEPYDGLVYSMTVSHNQLFVADGIVTHNCQAIYGFRGAHTSSMPVMKKQFSMEELSLSVSFRCPKAVVRLAQVRAPNMKSPDWAIEGKVEYHSSWSADTPPDGAVVICRNNAPLFKVAMHFIRNGRGVKIVGNDIGAGLVKILKKLGESGMTSVEVIAAIESWRTEQIAKASHSRVGPITDRAECLLVFAEQGKTLGEAIAFAEHLFSASGPVQFMTIHKSKGLEFKTVFYLDAFLIPTKWTRAQAELGDGTPLEQERNLNYVGITRAQEELHYVRSDELI